MPDVDQWDCQKRQRIAVLSLNSECQYYLDKFAVRGGNAVLVHESR
jgi:hypothetical protein